MEHCVDCVPIFAVQVWEPFPTSVSLHQALGAQCSFCNPWDDAMPAVQRVMLTQAIEDVCSSPAALMSVMADPEPAEGPGSPNRSSPGPIHGFSIERVNQTYRAILQVCAGRIHNRGVLPRR